MNIKPLPALLRNIAPSRRSAIGAALVLLAVSVPVRAGVIATIDFENNPSLPTQPIFFEDAGPMQTYTSPGVFTISGGVVLGNPNFITSFLTHGTPPNAYGTSFFGDVTLLPAITVVFPAAEGVTNVAGVLFNGQSFLTNYQVQALSGLTAVATQNFSNVPIITSPNGFVNFSVSSTPAQPITQVTITTTSNIDIDGWDFFVDTLTASSGAAAVPEPSSVIMFLGGLAMLGYRARWRLRNRKA